MIGNSYVVKQDLLRLSGALDHDDFIFELKMRCHEINWRKTNDVSRHAADIERRPILGHRL
jgi:hypothetical protein